MNFPKSKISIILIHNNDQLRIFNSCSTITKIINALESFNFKCNFKTISFQPVILSSSKIVSTFRLYIYLYLDIIWSKYRKLFKYPNFFKIVYYLFKSIIKSLIPSKNSSWKRKSSIEVYLTAKHIRAWEDFVDSDSDFLLVCEDDIGHTEHSLSKMCNLMNEIYSFKEPLYIDIAGGLPIEALKVKNLISEVINDKIIFSRPVTNTACCYLINKSFIKIALTLIIERPYLRYIGADWLINYLFIEMCNKGVSVYCEHYFPPILSHGTFMGHYKSSIS